MSAALASKKSRQLARRCPRGVSWWAGCVFRECLREVRVADRGWKVFNGSLADAFDIAKSRGLIKGRESRSERSENVVPMREPAPSGHQFDSMTRRSLPGASIFRTEAPKTARSDSSPNR